MEKPDVKTCSFTEYKTWVFENVVICTGLRLSSLLNIKVGDVDFEDNSITINSTKNKEPLKTYFNKELSIILKEYLQYRGNEPDSYLICSDKGYGIHSRSMQKNVERYNHKRGVEKKSIHLFRHTFAKNATLAGMDVFTLMKALQHSDIKTTMDYVQMLNLDVKKSCDIYNPQKQFGTNKRRITMKKR